MRASLGVTVCLLLFALAARAEADAPFQPHELTQALSARAPAWVQPELRVQPSEGGMLVSLRGMERQVALGAAHGAEAARVVALVVAEMARELVDAQPIGETPAAVSTPAQLAGDREVVPALSKPANDQPRPLASASDHVRIWLDVAAQRGAEARDFWGFDVGVGASMLVRKDWFLAARVGYWLSVAQQAPLSNEGLRFHALSVRALLGVRLGMVELSAGPLVAPFWIEGQRLHRTLPGGCLHVALALPVVSSLRMFTRAQLDLLGAHTRFLEGTATAFTTPRFMFGLALGFAWGWS